MKHNKENPMAQSVGHSALQPMAGIDVPISAFGNTSAFIRVVREGVPGKVVKQAVDVVGQRDLFVGLVGVSSGNLNRVYRRPSLSAAQSEALLDALWVFYRASTVLGGLDAAHEWLETPLPAMGGQRPLEFCDTFSGRRLVQQAIAKIEHGEFP